MITSISLNNFMSYGKTMFDFSETAQKAKEFIAVYGENGSGKSNFVLSIFLLCKSLNSINSTIQEEELETILKTSKENNIQQFHEIP